MYKGYIRLSSVNNSRRVALTALRQQARVVETYNEKIMNPSSRGPAWNASRCSLVSLFTTLSIFLIPPLIYDIIPSLTLFSFLARRISLSILIYRVVVHLSRFGFLVYHYTTHSLVFFTPFCSSLQRNPA